MRNFLTSLWVCKPLDISLMRFFLVCSNIVLVDISAVANFVCRLFMTTEALDTPLACRQETDKHQKQNTVLKWDSKTWSSQEYYTTRDSPLKLSFPKSHIPETPNQSLSSEVSHAVRTAPFQPKLPLLLAPSLLLSPPSLPFISLSFLWTCLESFSTALDTPPKNTWSPTEPFSFLCAD